MPEDSLPNKNTHVKLEDLHKLCLEELIIFKDILAKRIEKNNNDFEIIKISYFRVFCGFFS